MMLIENGADGQILGAVDEGAWSTAQTVLDTTAAAGAVVPVYGPIISAVASLAKGVASFFVNDALATDKAAQAKADAAQAATARAAQDAKAQQASAIAAWRASSAPSPSLCAADQRPNEALSALDSAAKAAAVGAGLPNCFAKTTAAARSVRVGALHGVWQDDAMADSWLRKNVYLGAAAPAGSREWMIPVGYALIGISALLVVVPALRARGYSLPHLPHLTLPWSHPTAAPAAPPKALSGARRRRRRPAPTFG